MNFLALCQRLRSECGLSGTGPSTIIGQTGEQARLVNWCNEAWLDIQATHQDWGWLRTSTTFATTANKTSYAPLADLALSDFGMWARDSFRVYSTAAGTPSETFLTYLPYDAWRDTYLYGALRTSPSRPVYVTIGPDKSLSFGPHTDAGYTIVGDYFKAPSYMAADADIPALPAQWHMAIVYRAMMFYGGYDAAGEVYQRGELEFTKMMRRMTKDRTPELRMGGTLA